MSLKDEEANRHWRECLAEQFVATVKEFIEGDEVAEALTHLLSVDGNHIVMHPIVHRFVTEGGARLSYFAFVVREH